jgi:hypothetical protein
VESTRSTASVSGWDAWVVVASLLQARRFK